LSNQPVSVPLSTPPRVAVIGAGIGGMAAAYDLARRGRRVSVFETAGYVGGLAAGFKEPHWDWSVEKFYHHWFQKDGHILGLIHELGWSDQVIFPRPYTVMYHQGKFYPFDAIPQMALFPGLGWGLNKIRFGLVGLFLKLTNDWHQLEKTTVDAWMRKWAGNQVYEMMWEPMMVGKFGERYSKVVNMAWLWARIKARTTRLGTFQGGFQEFSDRFADRLRQIGVEIHLSTPVRSISTAPGGNLRLEFDDGVQDFDQCLVTTSPALLARMAPTLPSDYLRGLLELKSMGAVVMVLALKKRLSEKGYYWYNIPKSAGFPFLALVEHTNFVSPDHFGGEHIVYIGDYLEPDHEYFRMSEAELLAKFLPSLPRINPQFNPDWVRKTWLFRTSYAQPIPEVNHSRNIPSIQTPLAGLYFASMSQVYPWDRGTNFAVEIGRKAAGMMIKGG
jgi:protoporphyrinogen oxidase